MYNIFYISLFDIMKIKEKEQAILLRKQGKTYDEIRKIISVSKSTLSLWLRSVGLAKKQKQRVTEKRLLALQRGHKKWRQMRVDRANKIIQEARADISKINKQQLFFMGVMLYWAEGSKEKEHRPGQGVYFSNSDPKMISIFLLWLRKIFLIPDERLLVDIYIHESHKSRIIEIKRYWAKETGLLLSKFDKIYFKKHTIKTNRKKIDNDYFGQIRLKVRRSTDLNRKISGWIQGIVNSCSIIQQV